MLRSQKAATPLTAATVGVPLSVAPMAPVPGAIAMVTGPANPVTVFPNASRAATCTAGVMTMPVGVFPGFTVKIKVVAGPGVMLNAALVASTRLGAVAVSV